MTTKKPLPNRKADQPEQASGNSCPAAKDEPQTPDPYDPERFRLSQDFAANAGVKKILTKVSCRKPDRQEFIRVRPDEGWRLQTVIFEDRNGINSEAYLIEPDLLAEVEKKLKEGLPDEEPKKIADAYCVFWSAPIPTPHPV